MSKEVKVKSLAKAIKVLECFKTSPELGVTEISEMLGLHKSNVYDMLSTFQAFDYIAQNEKTGKYHLGYKVLDLSNVVTTYMGFRKTVYPHMQKLAQEVGETIYFGIPDGFDVLYLDTANPGHTFFTRTILGERVPMYCTGMGKAMLSQLDKAVWSEAADQGFTIFTDRTITDRDRLIEELECTRKRGYGIDDMEHVYGIVCVGIALLNDQKQPVAGISISGPSLRFGSEKIAEYGMRLMDLAAKEAFIYNFT